MPPAAPPATASMPGVPASTAPSVDPALEARRKQLEQQEAAKRKADEALAAQQRAQNCERARAYLRTLDSGQRVARTNAQGEREILDERAIVQESGQARQSINANCR